MRFFGVMFAMLCLVVATGFVLPPLAALAVSGALVYLAILGVIFFSPLLQVRPYRMTGVAWAQIQAVGLSLQVGGTIMGIAPESWFQPGRGRTQDARVAPVSPSKSCRRTTRTAFGRPSASMLDRRA